MRGIRRQQKATGEAPPEESILPFSGREVSRTARILRPTKETLATGRPPDSRAGVEWRPYGA
jgi:hypothetical protein